MNNDVFGQSCIDFLKTGDENINITVESDIAETDIIPVSYLFRDFNDMPVLEKKALLLAGGNILDVGACAGSHSLYLQNNGKNVTSLDYSEGCCSVMKERGLNNIICDDIYSFSKGKFDTILLLMNGIGIAGTLENLPVFFNHLRSLLNPGGRIIFDSSDLQYLYMEDDGSLNIPFTDKYYGEICYNLKYKNFESDAFPWLFADPFSVESIAAGCGLKMRFISEGEHYDYLACLEIL